MGIRKEPGVKVNDLEIITAYKKDLSDFGVDTDTSIFFSDLDTKFLEFVHDSTEQRVRSGECQQFEQSISFCSCGKVEIPSLLLEKVNLRSHLKLVRKTESGWECVLCGQKLKESKDSTLIHRLMSLNSDIKILPENRVLKVRTEMENTVERAIVVSRTHRNQETSVTVSGKLLDPDYCWLHYLDFLNHSLGLNDFIVVAGINQIAQASKLILFTNTINPNIRLSLVVSSIMDLEDVSKAIHSKTTTEEFVTQLGSTKAARLFVASLAQWKREVCKVNCDDIYLIKKTLSTHSVGDDSVVIDHLNIDDVMNRLNREFIMRVLKKIRQGQRLDASELRIFSSIT